MELDKLPADTLELTLRFLAGYDAFYLSHACSWLLRLLSDDKFWLERLPPVESFESHEQNGKRRYMKTRSLLFVDGTPSRAAQRNRTSQPFVQPRDVDAPTTWMKLRNLSHFSFSFVMWFALLPATDERPAGGIIYGMQSSPPSSNQWPNYHQQIIIVDAQRNLYCSVLDAKKAVAHNLEANQWYHLGLTYDNKAQRQDVYVDGDNVWTTTGGLHHEWRSLVCEQVGTGCVTAGIDHFPYPGSVGWYPFNGVIDDFCLHGGVWSAAEIAGFATSSTRLTDGDGHVNSSLKVTGNPHRVDTWANALLVRCSRPAEGKQLCIEKRRSSSQ